MSAAVLLAAALWPGIGAAATLEISGDHRLFESFVEDGAIVKEAWFEISGRYDDRDDGSDLTQMVAAAFRLGRNTEAGFAATVLDRHRDEGASLFGRALADELDETGLGDARFFGKYRLMRTPFEMAAGAAATVPLADEDRGLGPGAFAWELFLGARRSLPRLAIIGSLGLTDREDARSPGRSEGRRAVLVGAGVVVPLSYDWNFVGEVRHSGPRYSGESSETRVAAGADWRPTEMTVIRAALAAGSENRDVAAIVSAAFHF